MADQSIENLPPHVRAQLEAQGQNLAQNGVENAPPEQKPAAQTQDVSQLPDHVQDQVAAQGATLQQNDVQATGQVSQASGQATDWSQKPGGDVPEPQHVEPISQTPEH